MRLRDLDAVTVDGFGTLVELEDPVFRLGSALLARGVSRSASDVAAAFKVEACFYRARAHLARDEASLKCLRLESVRVFLDHLGVVLAPPGFVQAFLDSLVFRPVAGAWGALAELRSRDLLLAVVSNWDCSLAARLCEVGLYEHFDTVVTSADAGAPKPDPAVFRMALERLGVEPHRALHIGDESADERGARSAGMGFAPAPLATAVQRLM